MAIIKAQDGTSDPIITRMVAEDKVPWYKKPNLRLMYLWLFLCCMGVEMTSGFDSQLIGTLQFSQPFNKFFGGGFQTKDTKGVLKYDIEPGILGFISSCYQLGSIIAVPIAPWINRRYGRRWCIMIGSITMVFGAILQGFAQNTGMYIVSRMILGMGILLAIIAGSALIGELAYPKERATLTSLFNASYFIGAIIASAITIRTTGIIGNWSWRIPSLLQICPSLLQICTVFLLPESPRWLISKDRDDEAFAVLTKYHAEGDADSVLVKAEMAQIRSTIKLEMEQSSGNWGDLFKTPGMRRRTFIAGFLGLFTQMSGNTLLSYYQNLLFGLIGYTSEYAKTRINIANNCWSLINATIIALIVTRFRRRWMFMLSAGSMTLVFMSMTICFQKLEWARDHKVENRSAQLAALFFYFSYSPCYNIGNNSLTYTYLIELFPFAQRSMGIGFEQMFGKLGGFFSINVNPIAMKALTWKYFAIYCVWIAFEFTFVFFMYPETYGRTLEELTFLFEDKALADEAVKAVEKQVNEAHVNDGEEHGNKSHVTTVERTL